MLPRSARFYIGLAVISTVGLMGCVGALAVFLASHETGLPEVTIRFGGYTNHPSTGPIALLTLQNVGNKPLCLHRLYTLTWTNRSGTETNYVCSLSASNVTLPPGSSNVVRVLAPAEAIWATSFGFSIEPTRIEAAARRFRNSYLPFLSGRGSDPLFVVLGPSVAPADQVAQAQAGSAHPDSLRLR
jgi:hypothetical protein